MCLHLAISSNTAGIVSVSLFSLLASIRETLQPYSYLVFLAFFLFLFYKFWRHRHFPRFSKYFENGNSEKAFAALREAAEHYPKDYRIFLNWGWLLVKTSIQRKGSDTSKLLQEACTKFQTASLLKPNKSEIYFNWGNALSKLAIIGSTPNEQLLHEAFEKFDHAARLRPNDHRIFVCWGVRLSRLAVCKDGAERENLLHQSLDKIEQAHKIKPKDPTILYEWGMVLSVLAYRSKTPEYETLYLSAIDKYKKSIKIKSDYADAYCSWGDCLRNLAPLKEGADRQLLYREAVEQFDHAVRLAPDNPRFYSDSADFLLTFAMDTPLSDCEIVFQKAFDHFRQAAELSLDSECAIDMFDHWGIAHLEYIKGVQSADSQINLELAKEKFLKAESLKPGNSAYNLACVFARQNNPTQCHHWLDVARQHQTLPPTNEMLKDPDLDSVRNEDWFRDFTAKTE